MKIIILSVGKTRDGHLAALADRYFQRISPFLKAGLEIAPESKDGNAARKVEREGKEILKKIRERDFVVVLDEEAVKRTASLLPGGSRKCLTDLTEGLFLSSAGHSDFPGKYGTGRTIFSPCQK